MFDINKVEIGDILQHKIKGKNDYLGIFISWFSLSKKDKYAHSAGYIGKGKKAEAHMGHKFGEMSIDPKEYKWIDIWRIKGGMNPKQYGIFLRVTKRYYGRNYDPIGLIGTIRSTLGKLFSFKWLSNSDPIFNNPKDFFCSEIMNRIYEDMVKEPDWVWGKIKFKNLDLAPDIHEEATQPTDLNQGGKLYKVS